MVFLTTPAHISFYYVVALHVLAWVYGWIVNEEFVRDQPTYDWVDKGFVKGFFVLVFWGVAQQSLQNFLYYFLSTKTDNITEMARLTGILRGQESWGQAVSYGLNTKKWYGGHVPLAVNTILLGLAVAPTWIALKQHTPVEMAKDSDEEVGSEKASLDGSSEVSVLGAKAQVPGLASVL